MAHGLPRVSTCAAVVAVCAGASFPASAAAGPRHAIRPAQMLAALLDSHGVATAPAARTATVDVIAASRPLTGERTVLPVIGRTRGPGGVRWLRVMLPGRPNGRTGWIRQQGTVLTRTTWRIVVKTRSRRLFVYRAGQLVRSFAAVVGEPSTPTPRGHFFVEEIMSLPADSAGAPYAFALSSRSTVYSEFDGGPGQIAIHGVTAIGGTPGTAESHGCVRLEDAALRWLAAHIGDGVPVTIRL